MQMIAINIYFWENKIYRSLRSMIDYFFRFYPWDMRTINIKGITSRDCEKRNEGLILEKIIPTTRFISSDIFSK